MDSIHFESPSGPTLLDESSLSALATLTGQEPFVEDGWICIPDRALRSSAAASDKTGTYPWRFVSIQLIEHLGLRSDVAEEILCRWRVAQGDPSCEFHGLPIVHTVMAFIKQKRNEMDLLADGKGRDWYSALHELGADRDMIDMVMHPAFDSRRPIVGGGLGGDGRVVTMGGVGRDEQFDQGKREGSSAKDRICKASRSTILC